MDGDIKKNNNLLAALTFPPALNPWIRALAGRLCQKPGNKFLDFTPSRHKSIFTIKGSNKGEIPESVGKNLLLENSSWGVCVCNPEWISLEHPRLGSEKLCYSVILKVLKF